MKKRKILIFRLSSLGDVILSTSILETIRPVDEVTFVTSLEWKSLLEGHPKVDHFIYFDRKKRGSLFHWIQFLRKIEWKDYDLVFDLHRNIRTRIAKLWTLPYFWNRPLQWQTVSKERLRTWLFLVFKSACPKSLRPSSWNQRFQSFFLDSPKRNAQLNHLVDSQFKIEGWEHKRFWAVMPSSAWKGKVWTVQKMARLIQRLEVPVVVLGTASDEPSILLLKVLKKMNVEAFNGIGKWNLKELASVFSLAEKTLAMDTGLAHLSEAVGTPVVMWFGPTHPDLGFGPSLSESKVIQKKLFCRPCGKTGKFCYRLDQPYACLQSLEVDEVLKELKEEF